VDLIGDTFINEHTNITSSTFNQVPDVPVSTFELYLPQGPDSALAANGNLCTSNLKMPTAYIAQNGKTVHTTTPITTTNCSKAKSAKSARSAKRHGDGHAASHTTRHAAPRRRR
jgi:hypothetical protein